MADNEALHRQLTSAIAELQLVAEREGLRWVEPHIGAWSDPEGEPFAEWFGNGPQGSEPGRMMLHFNHGRLSSFTTDRTTMTISGDDSEDHADTYRRYLKTNGWKP